MRVLLLSDVQEVGGAGIAAGRLARALINAGHEVIWLAGRLDQPPRVESKSYAAVSGVARVTLGLTRQLSAARGDALRGRHLASRVEQLVEQINPDVINVHNLHGCRLPADLPMRLSQRRPVVWTLHDMWAFTGTCTYAMDCRAFESQCTHRCPQCRVYPRLEPGRVPAAFNARRDGLRRAGRLAFATPSAWLMHEARRGLLRDQTIEVIPNSLDCEVFRPLPRDEARRALAVEAARPLLLATAAPGDARKGHDVLAAALGLIEQPLTLMTYDASIASQLPAHVAVHVLAPTRDERRLALSCNAADLHVLPTRADNLPNTLLEAAACGTPSVASCVGGVGEAIEHERTGWLCAPGDPADLARAIERALRKTTDATRRACRDHAVTRYHPSRQAHAYASLFTRLAAPLHAAA